MQIQHSQQIQMQYNYYSDKTANTHASNMIKKYKCKYNIIN